MAKKRNPDDTTLIIVEKDLARLLKTPEFRDWGETYNEVLWRLVRSYREKNMEASGEKPPEKPQPAY